MKTKKAEGLVMAAVLAVTFAVPTLAVAGPKFEELERGLPAGAVEADAIYSSFVSQLGTDAEAIKAVQKECTGGRGTINGAFGPQTQGCVRTHAETISRARKHEVENRAALERELGIAQVALSETRGRVESCDTALGDCEGQLESLTRERDDALARASSGAGEDYDDLTGVCAKVDLSQFVGTCDPVTQNARCVPDEDEPLGFTIACVPKKVHGEVESLTIRPDGSADAKFGIKPQKGTLTPAALPWQVPPPPPAPLSSGGWCDGDWLCRMFTVTSGTSAAMSAVALGFSVRDGDTTATTWSAVGLGTGVAGAILSPALDSWIPGALGTGIGVAGVSVAGSRGVFFQIKR